MFAGQDGAVLRPAQGEGDGGGFGDANNGLAGAEGFEPVRGLVFVGIVGVQLLDMEVLIVDIGRGQAPAGLRAPPGEDDGHAGDGAADDGAGLQLKAREIPDRRRAEAQMRVIGQKRAARSRPYGGGGESVGRARQRAGLHRVQRVARRGGLGKLREGLPLEERRIIQRRDAVGGVIRDQIGDAFGRQKEGGAGADDLLREMAGELQRHDFHDGDAVGGLPRGNVRREQEKLGRAAPQGLGIYGAQPRVDALRIGLQHGECFRVLCCNGALRVAV